MMGSTGFFPSEEELDLVAQIYHRVGTPRPDVIHGPTAAEIFEACTDLPPAILSAVWDIADKEKAGYLSERGVAIALRLIGWAQSGEELSAGLVRIPGPVPQLKGISEVKAGPSSPAAPPKLPPFTESDRDAFQKVFEACSPTYGLLEGGTARDTFLKCGLAPRDVWKMWEIADTHKRGALDRHDFALAMYLIQGLPSGQLSSLPSTSVAQIYGGIVASFKTYGATSSTPSSPVQRKPSRPQRPARKPPSAPGTPTAPPLSPREIGEADEWAVTRDEKASADEHFDSLDTQGAGYVDEDVAARFLMGFQLSPEDLAHIWDLADFNKDNRLTRDGFAIAIHLIEQRRNGAELPRKLPPSLVPPSLRGKSSATPRQRASTIGAPKKPQSELRRSLSGALIPLKPPQPRLSTKPSLRPKSAYTVSEHGTSATTTENPFDEVPPLPPKPSSSPILDTISPTTPTSPLTNAAKPPRRVQSMYGRPTIDPSEYHSLKQQTLSLTSQLEELKAQLADQQDTQAANATLTKENTALLSKIQEMEQITSQLLQANEAVHPMAADLTRENTELARRVAEMEPLQSRLDEASRRLDGAAQENRDIVARLREVREEAEAAGVRSLEEVEGLKRKVGVLEEGNEELRKRAGEMERTISRSQPMGEGTNAGEMQILMGDVTRENEALKARLRDMEASTASLLLSEGTGGVHAAQDGLRRENQRLRTQVQELEGLTKQLQTSSEDNELQRVLRDVTHENEALKSSLRQVRGQITHLQASGEPLRREIFGLKREVRRLQTELRSRAPAQVAEDPSIPPPAYEDPS
ncbi:hypothetical protein FPV67DRAFT_1760788 [Lyophyllum atratum]|nr:hypothetical protein FPV67DRAFT_1760788 [Lyophyllum atratum]